MITVRENTLSVSTHNGLPPRLLTVPVSKIFSRY